MGSVGWSGDVGQSRRSEHARHVECMGQTHGGCTCIGRRTYAVTSMVSPTHAPQATGPWFCAQFEKKNFVLRCRGILTTTSPTAPLTEDAHNEPPCPIHCHRRSAPVPRPCHRAPTDTICVPPPPTVRTSAPTCCLPTLMRRPRCPPTLYVPLPPPSTCHCHRPLRATAATLSVPPPSPSP